ncbi:MAG: 1,4-dihydroxy-2-naphthoate octaprenyltransferase [Glaciecola sp.]|jgi:1,4-dihydroxy-2-naphthoate octaprenyltransferase
MKRSFLNSVFFALLYGALPLQIISLIYSQWAVWSLLGLPILFVLVRSQDYLYQKGDKTYFRRVPFSSGVRLNQIKDMGDLKLVDTSSTIKTVWASIELRRLL